MGAERLQDNKGGAGAMIDQERLNQYLLKKIEECQDELRTADEDYDWGRLEAYEHLQALIETEQFA